MDSSTPGFPVHHYILKFAQIHVHWVNDTIQLFHPRSPPSPPALSLSQHQGLFQWVGSLHQVVTVVEFQLQPQSFQWIFNVDLLEYGLFWSPWCKGLSRVFSRNKVRKHQFLSTEHSLWFNSHICTGLLGKKKHRFDYMDLLNMLSSFVIAFLPRSRHLLISWLQSPSSVILQPKKIKSVTVSILSPSICFEVMGLDAVIFIFLNVEF